MHTPTPWKTDDTWVVAEGEITVADCYIGDKLVPEMEENAKQIVRAVNAYEYLVAALEAQEAFDSHSIENECGCADGSHCDIGIALSVKAQELRQKALAKAKEASPCSP